jgi:hypothetical protein
VAETGARRGGARPVLFYKRPGRETTENQLAPARCTAATMMAHNAGDETAQGGLPCEGASTVHSGGEAVPNSTGAGVMVERDGGWRSAGIASVWSLARRKG